MSGAIHLLPLYAFMAWTRTTLYARNKIITVLVIYYVANY
jgi:hypothetical protein